MSLSVFVRPRAARAIAVGFAAVAVAMIATTAILSELGTFVPLFASLLVYAGVGALLVWQRPTHTVGWLLLWFGLLMEVSGAAGAYSWHTFVRTPGSLPFGTAAVVANFAWVPGLISLCFAMLLFPNGRLPSARWRIPAAVVLGSSVLMLGGAVLGPSELQVPTQDPGQPTTFVSNPLALAGPLGAALRWWYDAPFASVIFLVPAAAIVSRLRASRGVERQQMKLFAYTTVIAMGFFALVGSGVVPLPGPLVPLLTVAALDLAPIAIAFAVLRHGLYDIDVLINRTLVYGALSATLVATYAAFVILLQSALRPFTGGSELAVAASTLATLALVQPFRRRIQEAVDRRFYRRRYDAARILDAFSARLRDEVDLDAVRTDLLEVVGRAVEPAQASVWLRETTR